MRSEWLVISVLGFSVRLLLIMGTYQWMGYPIRWGKACFASLLGGISVGACFIPGFAFLGQLHWRLIFLLLTLLVAFGWQRSAIRGGIIFSLLYIALCGIALGIGEGGIWSLLVFGATVMAVSAVRLGYPSDKPEYIPISVTHNGRQITLTALLDTGHSLRDPVTGLDVILLDEEAAGELLGLKKEELSDPVAYLASGKMTGMRLIPYCAIGQPAGMLLGLRPDEVRVNGNLHSCVVAFAPQKIGIGKPYRALTGGKSL